MKRFTIGIIFIIITALNGQSITQDLNMVLINSGDFWKRGKVELLSSDYGNGKYNKRTSGTIYSWGKKTIPYDYYMMKYEVTNQQYVDFLNEWNDVNLNYDNNAVYHNKGWGQVKLIDKINVKWGRITFENGKYKATPHTAKHPLGTVTLEGALEFAKYYGGDIPTQDEFIRAYRGDKKAIFIWDDVIGNYDDDLNKAELGKYANFTNSGDPYSNDGTTPVGFFNGKLRRKKFQTKDGVSPFGCYDLVGNAAEWVKNYSPPFWDSRTEVSVGGDWFHLPGYMILDDEMAIGGSLGNYESGFRVVYRNE